MAITKVIRYVVTYVPDKEPRMRTLAFPMQGRWTWKTHEEASELLNTFMQPHGLPRVMSQAEFASVEIRACECWAGHFDPCGVYFDD